MKIVEEIKKYRFLLILINILIFILFVDSPFSYLHYENTPYLNYFILIFLITILFLYPSKIFNWIENFFCCILISLGSTILGQLLSEKFLGLIYGFEDADDSLKSPPFVESIFYYLLLTFIGFVSLFIISKYKKRVF